MEIFDNIDKPVVRWDRMDENIPLFTLDSLKIKISYSIFL